MQLLHRVLTWIRLRLKVGLYHVFEFSLLDTSGKAIWSETLVNRFSNQGEIDALSVLYQAQNPWGAKLYGRLYNTTPVDASVLPISNEMSGNGYVPVSWDRNTTDWGNPATIASGEGETVGIVKTFTATGGDIGPFTYFGLTSSSDNSGRFIAYAPFSAPMTILVGASLQIRPRGRLRGVSQ